jgi:hypothetical protein
VTALRLKACLVLPERSARNPSEPAITKVQQYLVSRVLASSVEAKRWQDGYVPGQWSSAYATPYGCISRA